MGNSVTALRISNAATGPEAYRAGLINCDPITKGLDYTASHLGEPGSIPAGVAPRFSHVKIASDDDKLDFKHTYISVVFAIGTQFTGYAQVIYEPVTNIQENSYRIPRHLISCKTGYRPFTRASLLEAGLLSDRILKAHEMFAIGRAFAWPVGYEALIGERALRHVTCYLLWITLYPLRGKMYLSPEQLAPEEPEIGALPSCVLLASLTPLCWFGSPDHSSRPPPLLLVCCNSFLFANSLAWAELWMSADGYPSVSSADIHNSAHAKLSANRNELQHTNRRGGGEKSGLGIRTSRVGSATRGGHKTAGLRSPALQGRFTRRRIANGVSSFRSRVRLEFSGISGSFILCIVESTVCRGRVADLWPERSRGGGRLVEGMIGRLGGSVRDGEAHLLEAVQLSRGRSVANLTAILGGLSTVDARGMDWNASDLRSSPTSAFTPGPADSPPSVTDGDFVRGGWGGSPGNRTTFIHGVETLMPAQKREDGVGTTTEQPSFPTHSTRSRDGPALNSHCQYCSTGSPVQEYWQQSGRQSWPKTAAMAAQSLPAMMQSPRMQLPRLLGVRGAALRRIQVPPTADAHLILSNRRRKNGLAETRPAGERVRTKGKVDPTLSGKGSTDRFGVYRRESIPGLFHTDWWSEYPVVEVRTASWSECSVVEVRTSTDHFGGYRGESIPGLFHTGWWSKFSVLEVRTASMVIMGRVSQACSTLIVGGMSCGGSADCFGGYRRTDDSLTDGRLAGAMDGCEPSFNQTFLSFAYLSNTDNDNRQKEHHQRHLVNRHLALRQSDVMTYCLKSLESILMNYITSGVVMLPRDRNRPTPNEQKKKTTLRHSNGRLNGAPTFCADDDRTPARGEGDHSARYRRQQEWELLPPLRHLLIQVAHARSSSFATNSRLARKQLANPITTRCWETVNEHTAEATLCRGVEQSSLQVIELSDTHPRIVVLADKQFSVGWVTGTDVRSQLPYCLRGCSAAAMQTNMATRRAEAITTPRAPPPPPSFRVSNLGLGTRNKARTCYPITAPNSLLAAILLGVFPVVRLGAVLKRAMEQRWIARAGGNGIPPEKTRRPAASSGTIPTCRKSGSDMIQPAGPYTVPYVLWAKLLSSAYWSASAACSLGCCPAPGSYGISKVFPWKSVIGSEASRAGLINCDPIGKSSQCYAIAGTMALVICFLASLLLESESFTACLINCDPIAKSTSVYTCLTSILSSSEGAYGRQLHALLALRRSYAQGVQCFRRGAAVCKLDLYAKKRKLQSHKNCFNAHSSQLIPPTEHCFPKRCGRDKGDFVTLIKRAIAAKREIRTQSFPHHRWVAHQPIAPRKVGQCSSRTAFTYGTASGDRIMLLENLQDPRVVLCESEALAFALRRLNVTVRKYRYRYDLLIGIGHLEGSSERQAPVSPGTLVLDPVDRSHYSRVVASTTYPSQPKFLNAADTGRNRWRHCFTLCAPRMYSSEQAPGYLSTGFTAPKVGIPSILPHGDCTLMSKTVLSTFSSSIFGSFTVLYAFTWYSTGFLCKTCPPHQSEILRLRIIEAFTRVPHHGSLEICSPCHLRSSPVFYQSFQKLPARAQCTPLRTLGSLDRRINEVTRPMTMLILHNAEEHTKCILVDPTQGFQKCSVYREQPIPASSKLAIKVTIPRRNVNFLNHFHWSCYRSYKGREFKCPFRLSLPTLLFVAVGGSWYASRRLALTHAFFHWMEVRWTRRPRMKLAIVVTQEPKDDVCLVWLRTVVLVQTPSLALKTGDNNGLQHIRDVMVAGRCTSGVDDVCHMWLCTVVLVQTPSLALKTGDNNGLQHICDVMVAGRCTSGVDDVCHMWLRTVVLVQTPSLALKTGDNNGLQHICDVMVAGRCTSGTPSLALKTGDNNGLQHIRDVMVAGRCTSGVDDVCHMWLRTVVLVQTPSLALKTGDNNGLQHICDVMVAGRCTSGVDDVCHMWLRTVVLVQTPSLALKTGGNNGLQHIRDLRTVVLVQTPSLALKTGDNNGLQHIRDVMVAARCTSGVD
ncbi:hypothetical protein PR048_029550 [Dryococelus australis]|uniref:Uncharacterized protein n=1 Tax=Dryococelus australis TaxID=614101 RepID=A0ABQ9GEC3_9NEOP|nr:hypothetical protein PR048_029550 [Dryococelus australis]